MGFKASLCQPVYPRKLPHPLHYPGASDGTARAKPGRVPRKLPCLPDCELSHRASAKIHTPAGARLLEPLEVDGPIRIVTDQTVRPECVDPRHLRALVHGPGNHLHPPLAGRLDDRGGHE